MSCTVCEASPCTCRQRPPTTPVPPMRSTYVERPPGMTKEDFGLTLFDTIQTISGIRTTEEFIRVAIHKHEGYKLQELKARRMDYKTHLAALLPQLSDDEMGQILDRYPFVVTL